jgi:hypothetical protein
MNRIILAALVFALGALPATAKPLYPPEQEIKEWGHWWRQMDEASDRGDEQAFNHAGDMRKNAEDALARKGWCYADPANYSRSEWHWHRCRADELPFSPSAAAIDSELGEDQL